MTWQQDMSRAAVSIALPGWEWREGDVAEVEADWDSGGTFGRGEMTISVTAERDEQRQRVVFVNSEAVRFWMDLMRHKVSP